MKTKRRLFENWTDREMEELIKVFQESTRNTNLTKKIFDQLEEEYHSTPEMEKD